MIGEPVTQQVPPLPYGLFDDGMPARTCTREPEIESAIQRVEIVWQARDNALVGLLAEQLAGVSVR